MLKLYIRLLNLLLLSWNQMLIRKCETGYCVHWFADGLPRKRGWFRSPLGAFLWALKL